MLNNRNANIKDASDSIEDGLWELMTHSHSNRPFSTPNGFHYYLRQKCDHDWFRRSILNLHNCSSCGDRMEQCGGLYGPDDFALSVPGNAGGKIFDSIEEEQYRGTGLEKDGTFFVTQSNLDELPRTSDIPPYKRVDDTDKWYHIGLNPHPSFIISEDLANTLREDATKSLHDGSMDRRLEDIITVLQDTLYDTRSGIELIVEYLDDAYLVRKNNWKYRVNFINDVQKYASSYGVKWVDMDDDEKMHIRIFTLTYDALNSISLSGKNTLFEESQLVCDILKFGNRNIVSRMNSLSYIPLPKIVDEWRISTSLVWKGLHDFGLWVKTPDNDWVMWDNLDNEYARMDFDANSDLKHVTIDAIEKVSFRKEGVFELYVNMYESRPINSYDRKLEFVNTVNINGKSSIVNGVWDLDTRVDNKQVYTGDVDVSKMMLINTVTITNEMMLEEPISPDVSELLSSVIGSFVEMEIGHKRKRDSMELCY